MSPPSGRWPCPACLPGRLFPAWLLATRPGKRQQPCPPPPPPSLPACPSHPSHGKARSKRRPQPSPPFGKMLSMVVGSTGSLPPLPSLGHMLKEGQVPPSLGPGALSHHTATAITPQKVPRAIGVFGLVGAWPSRSLGSFSQQGWGSVGVSPPSLLPAEGLQGRGRKGYLGREGNRPSPPPGKGSHNGRAPQAHGEGLQIAHVKEKGAVPSPEGE